MRPKTNPLLFLPHLAIVLPRAGICIATPLAGTGTTVQAATLPLLLEQIAPQIARGTWLLVEQEFAATVRQLAPAARLHVVACLLCVGACRHTLPTEAAALPWQRDSGGLAAQVHLPRPSGTRWRYTMLIRPSTEAGQVVLDLLRPGDEGALHVEHRYAATTLAARALAWDWLHSQETGTRQATDCDHTGDLR